MNRITTAAAVAALAGSAALTPVIASASTSHSSLWQDKAKSVFCGYLAHAPSRPATQLLCSARDIPAPAHSSPEGGDPGFVVLGSTGKPQTIRTSQYSFATPQTKLVTLSPGTTWSSLRITCKVSAATVTCTNTSSHGFTIGNHRYKSF